MPQPGSPQYTIAGCLPMGTINPSKEKKHGAEKPPGAAKLWLWGGFSGFLINLILSYWSI
jgi:hypothetical protein